MTIRIRPITIRLHEKLDDRKLAALLTPTLLGSLSDDAPDGNLAVKPGTTWVRWSSAQDAAVPGLD